MSGLSQRAHSLAPEVVVQIYDLHAQGQTDNGIARELGLSPVTVMKYRQKRALLANGKVWSPLAEEQIGAILGLHAQGKSNNAIAKELGLSDVCVGNYIRKACLTPNNDRPKLSDELVRNIVRLRESGKSLKQIEDELGIGHTTAHSYLVKLGLIVPAEHKSSRRRPDRVGEDRIRCADCMVIKGRKKFPKNGGASCNACMSMKSRKRGTDVQQIHRRFTYLKSRCKIAGIPLSITRDDLIAIWNSQKGLCFYTDEPLVFVADSQQPPNLFSIDKIEPSKGYVAGNVVIASLRANTLKRDMSLDELKRFTPHWYRRIVKYKNKFRKLQPVNNQQANQLAIPFAGG